MVSQVRIDWAVHCYQTEDISLAKAAALAGTSFDHMKEILVQRGIAPRLGHESIEEALQELQVLQETLASQQDKRPGS
jgi:predicted HTH domain antitoxin